MLRKILLGSCGLLAIASSPAVFAAPTQINGGTQIKGVVPVTVGGTGTTTSTGSGSVVLGTSPTISSPIITGGTINNTPIGGTTAAAITGTTITASTAFSGPHNGTVGATTPNIGSFTTLAASSTVSGAGFSSYLAAPPGIGGTTPAAGAFTSLSASGLTSFGTFTYNSNANGILPAPGNCSFGGLFTYNYSAGVSGIASADLFNCYTAASGVGHGGFRLYQYTSNTAATQILSVDLAGNLAVPGTIAGTTITASSAFSGPHNGTVGATTPATGAFTTLSSSQLLSTAASTTGSASENIPQGVAPTTPNNGDVWTTADGLFTRAGGYTNGPNLADPARPIGLIGIAPDGNGTLGGNREYTTLSGTRTAAKVMRSIEFSDGQSGPASSASVFTPQSASYGLSIVGYRPSWNTSGITGEMDGINIFLRQASSDVAGILSNIGIRSGYGAFSESVTNSMDSTGAVVKGVNVQIDIVNPRDGGEYGVNVSAATGTALTAGFRAANIGAATWNDFFQGVNSSGTVLAEIRASDGAYIGGTVAPRITLGADVGAPSLRYSTLYGGSLNLNGGTTIVTEADPAQAIGLVGIAPDGNGTLGGNREYTTLSGTRTAAKVMRSIEFTDAQTGPASSAGATTSQSASYGLSIVGYRDVWNTSGRVGEMDGASIFLRQASGDVAGILSNVGVRSGYGAFAESYTFSADSAGAVVKAINLQMGVVNPRDTGEYGYNAQAATGTSLTAAFRASTIGTATWGDWLQFVNSSGAVQVSIRGSDNAYLGATVAPRTNLGGDLGAASLIYANSWQRFAHLDAINYASLSACSAGSNAGTVAYITDASAAITAWHQAVTAGGGTTKTLVQCLGAGWLAF